MRICVPAISFVFLGLLFFIKGFAQPNAANLTAFTEQDGVPGSQVSDVLVDNLGYIWLGTINGLARYDGYEFKRFYSNPNDSTAIKGLVVWSLFQDRKGLIWTATGPTYLDAYNPATRSFKNYPYEHLISHPANVEPGIRSICQDSSGRLYFAVSSNFGEAIGNGLLYFDEGSDEIKQYKPESGIPLRNVIDVNWNKKNGLWMISYSGLFNINNQGTMTQLKFLDSLYRKTNEYSTQIKFDAKDDIWIVTNKANLIHFVPNEGSFNYYSHPIKKTDYFYTNLSFDKKGNIWLGDLDGLEYFDVTKKRFSSFLNSATNSLTEKRVLDIMFDNYGSAWIGLAEGGLLKYEERDRFSSISNAGIGSNSILPGWISRFIETSDGHIWASSNGSSNNSGLNELDKDGKFLRSFSYRNLHPGINDMPAFKEISPGTFLLFTNLGPFQFSPRDGYAKPFIIPGYMDNSYINNFYTDKDQSIWICSQRGLYRKKINEAIYQRFDLSKLPGSNATSNEIMLLVESKRNGIWICSNNGLFFLHHESDKIERMGYDKNVGDVLVTQDINSLYEDSKGIVWVGEWQGGLSKFNPELKKITTYTRNEGLPSMSIQGILPDNTNQYLWLSTFDGLSRFDTKTGQSNNYTIPDGLQGQLFADGSYLATSGKLYLFGGSNGITFFRPEDLNKKSTPPLVYLTDLKLFDKTVIPGSSSLLKQSISETKQITLSYNQNNISIEYLALHYSNPGRNKYAYKMENYDNDWRYVGTQRVAFYPKLPPGTYIFKVKASNNNDVWNEQGATLEVIVLPPWWLTTWAFALYVLLLLMLGLLINRYLRIRLIKQERERNQTKELEQAKKIEIAYRNLEETHKNLKLTQAQLIQSEKMASLGELTAGIAHEIQNPLNFVNNFADVNTELIDELKQALQTGRPGEAMELAENIRDNEEKIKSHGQRADAIVKSMLQHSRNNSGDKTVTNVNQLAEEFLNLAFHGLRAKDKEFNTTLETDFKATPGTVNVIPQDIGRVLLNLYNNAFYAVMARKKRGEEMYSPLVSVSTRNLGDKVEIRVRDNGTGISEKNLDKIFQPFFTTKPTGEGTGLGLSISYDIVTKTHDGELKVETKEGEGTSFILLLK